MRAQRDDGERHSRGFWGWVWFCAVSAALGFFALAGVLAASDGMAFTGSRRALAIVLYGAFLTLAVSVEVNWGWGRIGNLVQMAFQKAATGIGLAFGGAFAFALALVVIVALVGIVLRVLGYGLGFFF